jgi:hypothetical protein
MVQTNCSETCLGNYLKTCVCESVNYPKGNVKTSVFEGFANWMQDDGNQQKYFKNIYKNPYKIDDKSV